MVLARKKFCLAGPVKVLSEGGFPEKFPGVYKSPAQLRAEMDERGWKNVAALQLRNPMHRSHEFLAKIAVEVCDGVVIHSLIGNLKPGDIISIKGYGKYIFDSVGNETRKGRTYINLKKYE
jgi:sulfate adenylyltransferase